MTDLKIKCPKCGEVITLGKSEYDSIVNEIKEQELNKKVEEKANELKAIYDAKLQKEMAEEKAKNNIAMQELQAKLAISETNSELKVSKALDAQKDTLNQKELEIANLKNTIENNKKQAIIDVNNEKKAKELEIKSLEEQVQYYKDFKAKQSVKLLGESLEQHCQTAFNQIRMAAFPNAYFEKDSELSEDKNEKGDYIFRDFVDGVELVSIMFDMKTEADITATKHKNEDFFKKLDSDRTAKKCEYAILVSTLEADNETYNGITDVSYRYDKMYVVRPQFFIAIISLLRNAALKSVEDKKALVLARETNIDIANFEQNLFEFKDKIEKNYQSASTNFDKAIDEIDKTISHLTKVKESLLTTGNQLRLANDKAQDLTIRKLTKNAPSVLEMIEASKNSK